jgi:thrombospondin type 3 repeat protein
MSTHRSTASRTGRVCTASMLAALMALAASGSIVAAGGGPAQPTTGPVDGTRGVVEGCDDFFDGSLLSPAGFLFPGIGAIPVLGTIFNGADVPDPAWTLVQRGHVGTLPKFRSVTGVIREGLDVGDYPGGFPQRAAAGPRRSPLGDEAVVNFEDFPDVHDSHDMNFFVLLDADPAQADVISTFGIDSAGREPGDPGYAPDTLEVEWETGILTSQRTGDGRFFPKWAWPLPGDRVWANGYWIFDCGHEVENHVTHEKGIRSEIHPPRAIASMRRQFVKPPAGLYPIPVTAADVYIHGRAGVVVDLLECGGRVILDNRACQTRSGETPRGSDSSDGNPGHDIALDHVGTPIDEDFQFTICTPPRPPDDGRSPTPVWWQQAVTPDNTVNIEPTFVVQDAAGACAAPQYGPKQLLVTIPLRGAGVTPDDAFARRMFVGWAAPPQPLREMRVTIDRLLMLDDDLDDDPLIGDSDDCECVWFWSSIDRAPEKVIRLSDSAEDVGRMNGLGKGHAMAFTSASWNVTVADGEPFTLRTFGFDGGVGDAPFDPFQDCLDDHFGHHDLGEHVDFGLGNLPSLCYVGMSVDPPGAIDDPFDVLRHEFTGSDINGLLGPWPGTGTAHLILLSPGRCQVDYKKPTENTVNVAKVTCTSEDQARAAFEAEGFGVLDVHTYRQYALDITLTALAADSDVDGLSDADETIVYHTDPLRADTDNDGLTDGAEVNTHHTNPLVPDTDGDGLTDGDEVNTHHTDPLDADTDDDHLTDGVEVSVGTNPLDADTDDDGLVDGRDPQFVMNAVTSLSASAWRSAGGQTAVLTQLESVERQITSNQIAQAVRELQRLCERVDGCGAAAASDDWIVDCGAQVRIRQLIDLLIVNLGT